MPCITAGTATDLVGIHALAAVVDSLRRHHRLEVDLQRVARRHDVVVVHDLQRGVARCSRKACMWCSFGCRCAESIATEQ